MGYDLVGQNFSWGRSSGHKVDRLFPGSDNAVGIDLKKRSYIHLDKQKLYMYGIQDHLRPVNFYRGVWLTFGAGIWASKPFGALPTSVGECGVAIKVGRKWSTEPLSDSLGQSMCALSTAYLV